MSEEKTISFKSSSLWKFGTVILAILLIASILTGGFGIKAPAGTGSAVQNTGNTAATGATQQPAVVDLSVFASNSDIYPSTGPDNAKNTVIEFTDFQCPYCALASGLPNWTSQFASQYSSLIGAAKSAESAAESGQIKFVFVTMNFLDNPQSQYGTESTYAAEAGFCANDQGKFWEMHDIIYSNQVTPAQEGVQFTKQQLTSMAAQIQGMNQSQFSDCLQTDKYLIKTQEITNAAFNAGVTGTPTFVINGKVLSDWTTAASILK